MKIDNLNWSILKLLQENARYTNTEIGRTIGLSSPAVAERIKKLEDIGVIDGYKAEINHIQTGYQLKAFVTLRAFMGKLKPFLEQVKTYKEVLNCYRITGNENLVMEVVLYDQFHLEEFIDKLILLTRSIRVGNPLSKETEMGPLTSRLHQARVLEYCKITEEEGGEILIGGNIPEDPSLANGCYISPTIVRANPTDRVCLEEVFGPFVSVTSFREEEEVIAMANHTEYGLGGGLWTNSLQRAHRVAKHMVSGMVWINCYKRVHPGSPFGGVRSSGYGREMGFEAMREYTTVKSVWVNVNASIPAYYPREN